jgi:hypothetical protein
MTVPGFTFPARSVRPTATGNVTPGRSGCNSSAALAFGVLSAASAILETDRSSSPAHQTSNVLLRNIPALPIRNLAIV